MNINGKVALVTGAGQEICRAITLRLANDGADIAIVDVNNAKMRTVAEEIRAIGRKSTAFKADVTNRNEVYAAVDHVEKELRGLLHHRRQCRNRSDSIDLRPYTRRIRKDNPSQSRRRLALGLKGEKMNQPIRILGIAGSLRKASFNRGVLRAAVELAPEGAAIEIFELDGIPGFNQDLEQSPPETVAEFKRKIHEADAILFVTPEYNYSIPGVLKNAIDWASRPYGNSAWHGKPAAIMGASMGAIATARAQYHLRQMMVFLNMFPVNQPEVMIGNAVEKFDDQGNLIDETTKDFIIQLVQNLVDWTRRLDEPKKMEKSQ